MTVSDIVIDFPYLNRLERLEAEVIRLRNAISAAMRMTEGSATLLERHLGAVSVALTEMYEAGDMTPGNVAAAAQVIAVQRRSDLAGARR